MSLLAYQKSHQQSTVNDWSDAACAGSVPTSLLPPYTLDTYTSDAEQLERACCLADYLQRRTTLQASAAEIGSNSHPCSQKPVLLTRTLKLIDSCLDGVINWAKAIPGVIDLSITRLGHKAVQDSYCWSGVRTMA